MPLKKKITDESFSSVFNKSAKRLHKSFPEQLKNILIISTEEPLFISPEIADHLSSRPQAIKKLIEKEKEYMITRYAVGIAYNIYPFEQKVLKLIALNTKIKTSPRYPNVTKNMIIMATADHELGHLVVKNGYPKNISLYNFHLAESAADAFAAIRHVQRFGTKTGWFKDYNRCHTILFNLSPIHYTNGVIEKIEKLRKTGSLSNLNLKETAELARKIAIDYSLKSGQIITMNRALEDLGRLYKEKTNYKDPKNIKSWNQLSRKDHVIILKELVKTMFENKDNHDLYRAGKLFLNSIDIKRIIKICHKDPFWIKTKKEMAEFEKESGITLNLADSIDESRKLKKIQILPKIKL